MLGIGIGLTSLPAIGLRRLPLPVIALDFTSGSLDPRVTATGGANGTRINSSGVIVSATAPRFDYDPATLLPLGLLIEEARTNLIAQSGDPSNGAWSGSAASAVTGQADPFGTTLAATITADGTSTAHARTSSSVSFTSGTSYAFSAFVKAGTTNLVQLTWGTGGFGATVYANFTLSGAGSAVLGAGATAAAIQQFPNGWYRITMVAASNATTSGTLRLGFITSTADTRAPTNSSADTFIATGGQVEATSTSLTGPTSYIPTAGSTVTRTAETAAMTGTNFSSWYNQIAGTFVVQATPPGNYNQAGMLFQALQNGLNLHEIIKANAAVSAAGKRWSGITSAAGPVAAITEGSDNAGLSTKLAYAYAANDFAFYVDAIQVGTDVSGTLPSPTELDIGYSSSSGQQLNGHIASLKYYNTRLTNAQMQTLTA